MDTLQKELYALTTTDNAGSSTQGHSFNNNKPVMLETPIARIDDTTNAASTDTLKETYNCTGTAFTYGIKDQPVSHDTLLPSTFIRKPDIYEVPPSLKRQFRNPKFPCTQLNPPQLVTPQNQKLLEATKPITDNGSTKPSSANPNIYSDAANGTSTPQTVTTELEATEPNAYNDLTNSSSANPSVPLNTFIRKDAIQTVSMEAKAVNKTTTNINLPAFSINTSVRPSTRNQNATMLLHNNSSPFSISNPYTNLCKPDTPPNGTAIWSYKSNSNRFKIFQSPFLDRSVMQPFSSLELNADLETLRPLILSQHEAFSQYIMDLGEMNLTLTKIIEKKKVGYSLLEQKKKISRSLCIKCMLSASPDYIKDDRFIQLKEEFDNNDANFIEKNTDIMKNWANINIQLLIKDRCCKIFKKVLMILDGLIAFHIEVTGTPSWPSISLNNLKLFITKAYLSNEFLNVTSLENYFEMPLDRMCLTCTKLISNIHSDEEAMNLFNSLPLSEINMNVDIQHDLILEPLLQFDQTLKITTIELWQDYKCKSKQLTAANNLKARMTALQVIDAQEQNLQTKLCLSNLEETICRNE